MALRTLVVNADDLGLGATVNAGILEAFDRGIVTSASLMVQRPAAAQAVAAAARRPKLALGLHLDLAEWEYADGRWRAAYRRCDVEDAAAVEAECRRQLARFRDLVGRPPTHLDSHQHVHMSGAAAVVAARLANELGVPLRGRDVRFEGGFYGQSGRGEPFPDGISVAALKRLLGELPPGVTEVGCHPGHGADGQSSYGAEREVELRTLCDPGVAAAVAAEGIRLASFAEIPRTGP